MEQQKRVWQSGEEIKITGVNPITGEELKYTFKEMNQEYGSEILHKYVLLCISQWDKLKGHMGDIAKGIKEEENKKELLSQVGVLSSVFPGLFSWENIKELARLLLADHSVEYQKTLYTSGESGFNDINDPLQIYFSIFYAVLANWPKYINPLLQALQED